MVMRRSFLPDIGAYGLHAGRTATLVLQDCYAKFNSARKGLTHAKVVHLGPNQALYGGEEALKVLRRRRAEALAAIYFTPLLLCRLSYHHNSCLHVDRLKENYSLTNQRKNHRTCALRGNLLTLHLCLRYPPGPPCLMFF